MEFHLNRVIRIVRDWLQEDVPGVRHTGAVEGGSEIIPLGFGKNYRRDPIILGKGVRT
jgi:hypothetical protein